MWNSGDPSCQPPPMMSQYNGSNFASNNGLSNTAARKASTMPHSPPWDIGTARSSATLRYTDRWTNMHHNDLLAMQASRSRPWSWGSLVYAMFVCGCCNIGGFCCGTIATVTAMTSYVDHKVGDYKRAAKKRRISLCLSSLGLIFGLSIIAVLLLLYFLLPEFNKIVNDAFTSVHTNIKKHNVTDTEGDNSPQSGTWLQMSDMRWHSILMVVWQKSKLDSSN